MVNTSTKEVDDILEQPLTGAKFPFEFVSVGNLVMNGNRRVAECCSVTMARRIARALNNYTPNKKGY